QHVVVRIVGDVNVAGGVRIRIPGAVDGAGANAHDVSNPAARGVEGHNPVVACVGDVDHPVGHGDPEREAERVTGWSDDVPDEIAVRVELDHAAVAGVD